MRTEMANRYREKYDTRSQELTGFTRNNQDTASHAGRHMYKDDSLRCASKSLLILTRSDPNITFEDFPRALCDISFIPAPCFNGSIRVKSRLDFGENWSCVAEE